MDVIPRLEGNHSICWLPNTKMAKISPLAENGKDSYLNREVLLVYPDHFLWDESPIMYFGTFLLLTLENMVSTLQTWSAMPIIVILALRLVAVLIRPCFVLA